jgi:hypothetical protein
MGRACQWTIRPTVSEENPDGDPLVKLATETFTETPDGPVSDWSLVVAEVPPTEDVL